MKHKDIREQEASSCVKYNSMCHVLNQEVTMVAVSMLLSKIGEQYCAFMKYINTLFMMEHAQGPR